MEYLKAATGVTLGFLMASAAFCQAPAERRPLTLGLYVVVPCGSPRASKPMQAGAARAEYCLDRSPVIDQTAVASAAVDTDAQNGPAVVLTLRHDAAERFRQFTRTSIGLRIATVLDGRLLSVALIAEPTRRAWISGLTEQEARSLIGRFERGAVLTAPPPELPPGNTGLPEPDSAGVYTVGHGIFPPMLIHKQEPEYTAAALATGIQGVVVLEVVVLADGTPGSIRVARRLDPGLDAKAVECVRAYRFRPARLNGKPVPVRVTVQIRFHL